MLKFFIFLIYLYLVWNDAVRMLIIAYGASWSLTVGQGRTSVMRTFSVSRLLTVWSIVLAPWRVGFFTCYLRCTCQVLLCMFQVKLMVCCNQYWYLRQLRRFRSKFLLFLKVSYLVFESISVFSLYSGRGW